MRPSARIEAARAEQWERPVWQQVTVFLPTPPSVNRLWTPRADGMHRSRRYETWRRAAGNAINAQRLGRVPGPYRIVLTVEKKGGQRPDLGNLEKAAGDILQEHGIIDNDRLAEEIVLRWSSAVEGMRVEIWPMQAEAMAA